MHLHFQERKILTQAAPWTERERKIRPLFFGGIKRVKALRVEAFRIRPIALGAMQYERRQVNIRPGRNVVVVKLVFGLRAAREQPDRGVQALNLF